MREPPPRTSPPHGGGVADRPAQRAGGGVRAPPAPRDRPPRPDLRVQVFAIDPVDDLIEFEIRNCPVDRRPPRLDGVALATKFLCNAPADLEARPGRRKHRPDPAGTFPAGFLPA